MCRNIRPLFNLDPPADEEEMRAAALQFVRKVSGYRQPPQVNQEVFNRAVDDISLVLEQLLSSLVTSRPPRDRAVEAEKAKARAARRRAG